MRKAKASVETRPAANTTAAARIAPAVLGLLMTSSIPAPGPAGRSERLAVTGEPTDLRQHLVHGEALGAAGGLAEPVRVGRQTVIQRLAVGPASGAEVRDLERALDQ